MAGKKFSLKKVIRLFVYALFIVGGIVTGSLLQSANASVNCNETCDKTGIYKGACEYTPGSYGTCIPDTYPCSFTAPCGC